MTKRFLTFAGIAVFALALTNCKDKAKEAETTAAEETAEMTAVSTKYLADAANSTIMWKGFKPTGTHTGTISIENGVLTMKGDAIESGTFLIDMNSITVTDIPAEKEGNAKLTGHLKSDDFFHVEQYPSSAFTVTGFEMKDGKGMLSGNLKMKDAENNITIPVTITENGDTVTLTSETFTIDRSKWNVKYGSKSFFDDLGDKFINDEFELQITLVANKES
ncbi:lipid-binding protein [Hanstruepera neustonica]|uniref:Lipid-binding protein n=1 Tax=Hanstruepera neustonica TaxID=1445657 RepID=A0A2K1DZA9_9FLAO|nr:YceI family protein [Hanstruepera neustonica]PNQ73355.1 lipid-binding protein [Hanstruepera neustonica]